MKNFNAYIGDDGAENIIFNAEKKLAILLYPKNASSSLINTFGIRHRDWTTGKVSTFKEDLSDYKIINCLRDPITRAISAMSQSMRVFKEVYGYQGENDGRKFSLERATDIHLRPQYCNVLSPHLNNLNQETLNNYFDNQNKTWNTFFDDYDAEHTVYSEIENPNQVWFLVSPHTNVILDIAKYLNYNIGQYEKTKHNEMDFDNTENIDVSVTKSFINSLEKTYKYDMLLFSKVKFENV